MKDNKRIPRTERKNNLCPYCLEREKDGELMCTKCWLRVHSLNPVDNRFTKFYANDGSVIL